MEASGRKVGGSQWKELQKAEVSVESMEIFTTSIEAPTTSMEGSNNLHEKKITFMKNIILLKIRETCQNCMKTWRKRSVTNFTERAKPQESSFSQI